MFESTNGFVFCFMMMMMMMMLLLLLLTTPIMLWCVIFFLSEAKNNGFDHGNLQKFTARNWSFIDGRSVVPG